MFGLCVMQILLLGVLFVTVSSLECHDEDKLEEKARKKLKFHPTVTVTESRASECPVGLYAGLSSLKDRSISPWQMVYDTEKGRFPETIAVAKCLCEGCILMDDNNAPKEDNTYNSAEVLQSRLFLRKEPCDDGNKRRYKLVPYNADVAVGCTCARYRS